MKINLTTGYGLIAVGYVAKHGKGRLVDATEIAKQYDIPITCLFPVLTALVRANVLRSKRGPCGGFSLARPAKNITLLEIIEALEGPIVKDEPIIEHGRDKPYVSRVEKMCRKAAEKERAVYARVTLASVLAG